MVRLAIRTAVNAPLAGLVVPMGVALRLARVAVPVEFNVVNAPLAGVTFPTGVLLMVATEKLPNDALPLTESVVNEPDEGVVAPIGVALIAAAVRLPVKFTKPLAESEVKAPAAGVEAPMGVLFSAATLKLANVAVPVAVKLVNVPDAGVVAPIGVEFIAAAARLPKKLTEPLAASEVKTPAAGVVVPIGVAFRLVAFNVARVVTPDAVKVVNAPVEPLIGVPLIAAAAKLPPKFTAPIVDNVENLPVDGVLAPIGMPSMEPAIRVCAPVQVLGTLSSDVLAKGNSPIGTLPVLSSSATPGPPFGVAGAPSRR